MKHAKNRLKLGELLIRARLITKEQLDIVLFNQEKSGEKLGKLLIKIGAISEKQLCETLGFQLGIPFVDLQQLPLNPMIVNIVPQKVAAKYTLIAFDKVEDTLNIAMVNPLDIVAIDDVKAITNMKIKVYVGIQSAVEEAINKYYKLDELIYSTLKQVSAADPIEVIDDEHFDKESYDVFKQGQEAPIVRLLDFILSDAAKSNASDIHIEPQLSKVEVRFRIDGLLIDRLDIPKYIQEALLSRVKILSGLDIAEKRKPQDGRTHVKIKTKDIDLRISTLPTIYGEKAVIRLLDKSRVPLNLDNLNIDRKARDTLNALLKNNKGIILVTGPTGSGKTTTLYAAICQIKSKSKNIVTVEDPVEYAIDGINQVQVNVKSGITFASGLRSILRQDPDVILVGEIRDHDTAQIAFESALTGHLVLSTLHTNSAPGAIIRLFELGVEHYLITESVKGIIAQRLVRRLCDRCKTPYNPEKVTLDMIGLTDEDIAGKMLYKPVGCKKCNQIGYEGRVAIFEILKMEQEIKNQITANISEKTLINIGKMAGMKTLKEDGIEKVFEGLTTFDEVLRVTYEEKDTVAGCPKCGKTIEQSFTICPYCQHDLEPKTCGSCGKELNSMWVVCPYCRTPVLK